MKGEQLKALRTEKNMTREQFADWLGDTSASTVNKWERDLSPVPQWVKEKVLNKATVEFPLDELNELLALSSEAGISFKELLREGTQLLLEKRRQQKAKQYKDKDKIIDLNEHMLKDRVAEDGEEYGGANA